MACETPRLKSRRLGAAVQAARRRHVDAVRGHCSPGLLDAIQHGRLDEARQLGERGAKGACAELVHALYVAISDNRLDRLGALLDAGADPNGGYADYCYPPLSVAYTQRAFSHLGAKPTAQRDLSALRLLLRHGADPNQRWLSCGGLRSSLFDRATWVAPLSLAATAGDVEFVEMLLEAGADRGARDRDGLTALDHARLSDTPGRAAIVALLQQ
jgi:hypothetical protein